jgi:hypothetical protein
VRQALPYTRSLSLGRLKETNSLADLHPMTSNRHTTAAKQLEANPQKKQMGAIMAGRTGISETIIMTET